MHILIARILNVSNYFQKKMFRFTKKSVSVYHPNTWTGLKNVTPMFLSVKIKVDFVFSA